jgi:hypothetical protein
MPCSDGLTPSNYFRTARVYVGRFACSPVAETITPLFIMPRYSGTPKRGKGEKSRADSSPSCVRTRPDRYIGNVRETEGQQEPQMAR